ncbi:glycoside hydrolase family 27 protein [Flavobacteriaceae bacterium]|nr:glycoside hydrolase family 27 protein [Flavobacteriaceae bacterium]
MKKYYFLLLSCIVLASCTTSNKQETSSKLQRQQTPIMGWSSWGLYQNDISEDIIKNQANALLTKGLKDVGFSHVNIDHGYSGGRDQKGDLISHPTKFPNGIKNLVADIHSKGLKVGLYTDAGINTCASYWNNDTISVGSGLYRHDKQDLTKMLLDWKIDHLRVDWCGAEWLDLEDEHRFTEISEEIKEIRNDVTYAVSKWDFPGLWVTKAADSWRLAADNTDDFEYLMSIADKNANFWKFCTPGHFNDMGELQVGKSMSFEEDKAHFTMWAALNSPLLLSNDLTKISDETLSIITNKDIINLNQDSFAYQARRLMRFDGTSEVWAKPLVSTTSGKVAVILLNRAEEEAEIKFWLDKISINPKQPNTVKNLWTGETTTSNHKIGQNQFTTVVPAHGVVVYQIEGTSVHFNIFQNNQSFQKKLQGRID